MAKLRRCLCQKQNATGIWSKLQSILTLIITTTVASFTQLLRNHSRMWWNRHSRGDRPTKLNMVSCPPLLRRRSTGRVRWMPGRMLSCKTIISSIFPCTPDITMAICIQHLDSCLQMVCQTIRPMKSVTWRGKRPGDMIRGAGPGTRKPTVILRDIREFRNLIWVKWWLLCM